MIGIEEQIRAEMVEAGAPVPEALLDALVSEVTPSDDGILIYTSGTTAQPKGVLHRQRAPVIQSWRFAEHYELSPADIVWTAQPFFWTAGICMSLGATLAAGGTLVLQETFDPEEALEAIEEQIEFMASELREHIPEVQEVVAV